MLRRLFLAHIALLVLPTSIAASGITNDSSIVSGKTFDYVIVGAGLAGTTIAVRLAEDPSVKILVVEPGGDDRDDPQVYDIYQYKAAFMGPLDWAWETDQGRLIHGYVYPRSWHNRAGILISTRQREDSRRELVDQWRLLDKRCEGTVRCMDGFT